METPKPEGRVRGRHAASSRRTSSGALARTPKSGTSRHARVADDHSRESRPQIKPSSRRRLARFCVMLVAVLLASAGVLTHFTGGSGRLAATDQLLMRMQRMGPPPEWEAAYETLRDDTVAVRSFATGQVVATGLFAGTLAIPASHLYGSSFSPGIAKAVATALQPYAAIFISPLRQAGSRTVLVDVNYLRLQGLVIATDESAGLEAVAVVLNPNNFPVLTAPPVFLAAAPRGVLSLKQLMMRVNPDLYQRSAGFIFTSGSLRRRAQSWCNTAVSGVNAGSPLVYVSASGSLALAGLAMPSANPGRCEIADSWEIRQFANLIAASWTSAGTGAYLGVMVESTATARSDGDYQGHLQGAFVISVEPGSAAAEVQLQPGDVIVRVDTKVITSGSALTADIHRLNPGSTHDISFVRDNQVRRVRVVLGKIAVRGSGS
jgi:PDZ domain